jgi:acetolactate synthase-1/2/3 large subunit
MKLSEFILTVFASEKISHAFMVPGGHLDPFMSSFQHRKQIQPIVACHEGGAVFMADGYARASGRFGVALGIGGPGITNMMTGIALAHTDHVPLFVVTGEAKMSIAGRGAFQDSTTEFLNDNALTLPLLSQKTTITDPDSIDYQMQLLIRKMLSHSNRGPVNLSVPSNIAKVDGDFSYLPMSESLYFPRFLDHAAANLVRDKMGSAVKVAILAGEGVVHSGASESLIKFAEKYSIPVATTLNAKGVIPEDHELALGVLGWFGNKGAHDVLLRQELEVLIVIGTRLHQADTLSWTKKLIPKKCLIMNDIDEASPFPNYHPDHFILGDAKTFLDYLSQVENLQPQIAIQTRRSWLDNEILHIDRYYDIDNYSSEIMPIHPARIAKELQKVMPKETVIFSGEGAGSFIVSHYWKAYQPRSFFSPIKYMSPMGWSIAAAIGG